MGILDTVDKEKDTKIIIQNDYIDFDTIIGFRADMLQLFLSIEFDSGEVRNYLFGSADELREALRVF